MSCDKNSPPKRAIHQALRLDILPSWEGTAKMLAFLRVGFETKSSIYLIFIPYKLGETKNMFFDKHPNLIQVHKQYYVNRFWIDKYVLSEGRIQLKAPFEKHVIYVGDTFKESLKILFNGRK